LAVESTVQQQIPVGLISEMPYITGEAAAAGIAVGIGAVAIAATKILATATSAFVLIAPLGFIFGPWE
jgi:hypothetical protein